jgi:hypothetical protein
VIVPIALFPPGTPFTLHVTTVSFVFATLAVKVCELPRSRPALVVVTVTLMDGGGVGMGVTRPAPPPPQPRVHAPIARRTVPSTNLHNAGACFFTTILSSRIRGRGRIPPTKAGQGPAPLSRPKNLIALVPQTSFLSIRSESKNLHPLINSPPPAPLSLPKSSRSEHEFRSERSSVFPIPIRETHSCAI